MPMIQCTELSRLVELQEPASEEAIVQAQEALGCSFPNMYIDLLRCSNGFSVPDVVSLIVYGTGDSRIADICERNTTFVVSDYLPEWLLIGDDGGGRGIFLDHTDQEGAVYIVGLGCMHPSDAILLAANLAEWVAQGFPLPE